MSAEERRNEFLTGPFVVGVVGAVGLAMTLGHAIIAGDFRTDSASMLENPWGQAAVVDAYVGLILCSVWIGWREIRRPIGFAWVAAVLALGNLVVCLYVVRAAWRAGGSWRHFWMGEGDRKAKPVSP